MPVVMPVGGSLRAAIFDLDGLLIDTEGLWHEAEVAVLGALGVPLAWERTRQTKGMVVEEVTRYWYERYPWAGPDPDEVAAEVLASVEALVVERAALRPGARRALVQCRRRGLALALASSSHRHYISVALERCGLAGDFDVVRSAQDEPYGKPHPGVFLSAAAELDVAPTSCVVFEDAPAGVLAAKAGRMRCVAVPDPDETNKAVLAIADAVLSSLEDLDEAVWARLTGESRLG